MIKTKEEMLNYLDGKVFHASRMIRFASLLDRIEEIVHRIVKKYSSLFREFAGKKAVLDEDIPKICEEIKVVLTYVVLWTKKTFEIDEELSMDFVIEPKENYIDTRLPEWMYAFMSANVAFSKNVPQHDPEFSDETIKNNDEEFCSQITEMFKDTIDENRLKSILREGI